MGKSAIDRVYIIWRWDWNMKNEKERQAALEYKRRYGLEYYAMPMNNMRDMIVAAANRAGSTDAVKVAYALEDLRIAGGLGEIWMRSVDHQLFEHLYILVAAALDDRDVNYDLEGVGFGVPA